MNLHDNDVAEKQDMSERNIVDLCNWCNLSEDDMKYLLYESDNWRVFLADEQDYIGRCILVLKRHCPSLAELNEDEWSELLKHIKKLEKCFKTLFHVDLCNWSCLMNSFFKEDNPCPHLHIHVRPRYKNPIIINESVYSDEDFGHHYSSKKDGKINLEDMMALHTKMKAYLNA